MSTRSGSATAPPAWDNSGAAVIEFAMLAPVLLLLGLGVLQFGPVLKQQAVLQVAAHQGAQVLSTGRTAASIWTQTTSAIDSAISTLSGTVSVTLSVCDSGGDTCTSCDDDSSCATLFAAAEGDAAQVKLTYPCVLAYPVVGPTSVCTLDATEYSLIQ